MCDIDRELVLRGAAIFATYAAERVPPAPDQFTAKLIEQALRAKLPNGVSNGKARTTRRPDLKGDSAQAAALLQKACPPHAHVPEQHVRLLVAARAEPERVFGLRELAGIGGYKDPSKNGSLAGSLKILISRGFFRKLKPGSYQLGPKGKGDT